MGTHLYVVMERIPHREVMFHPNSSQDPAGRVFQWRGHIYRGISAANVPLFIRLFHDGTIRRLTDLGLLVETERTDYTLDTYAMVVRHRRIPFVSYPPEWCSTMLRDAARFTLDVVAELAPYGLTLKDAHPWNILFDGCRPVYIDLTSIIPLGDGDLWPAYNEFCWEFCYPLLLMSHGKDRDARWFMDPDRDITTRDLWLLAPVTAPPLLRHLARSRFDTLCQSLTRHVEMQSVGELGTGIIRGVRNWLRWSHRCDGTPRLSKQLGKLRSTIDRMTLPGEPTPATRLAAAGSDKTTHSDGWVMESMMMHNIMTELQPESILSIDAGLGIAPMLETLGGCHVVAFETRPCFSAQLYAQARVKNLALLPLEIDYMATILGSRRSNQQRDSLIERFQCDLVWVPKLEALFDSGRSRFHGVEIVDALALLSKRWVVIRWRSHDGQEAGPEGSARAAWAALAPLTEIVRQRFYRVEVRPLGTGEGRLLIGEK